MVMKRKEAKDHGLKKMVEGSVSVGDSCLIIEDIVSSGTSMIETAEALRHKWLKVEECVVVNRNQGGLENLREKGIKLNSLFWHKIYFKLIAKSIMLSMNLSKKLAVLSEIIVIKQSSSVKKNFRQS